MADGGLIVPQQPNLIAQQLLNLGGVQAIPAVQRSQYLADALRSMSTNTPPLRSQTALWSNLAAEALLNWGRSRNDKAMLKLYGDAANKMYDQYAPAGQPTDQPQQPPAQVTNNQAAQQPPAGYVQPPAADQQPPAQQNAPLPPYSGADASSVSHQGGMMGAFDFTPPIAGAHQTSGYGERAAPIAGAGNFHPGIDLGVPSGTPVHPVAPGVVMMAQPGKTGYGNEVVIRHPDGSTSLYGHLSQIDVHDKQNIGPNDVLGLSGNTGLSTGPHLHLGMRGPGGQLENPDTLLGPAMQNGPTMQGLGGPPAQQQAQQPPQPQAAPQPPQPNPQAMGAPQQQPQGMLTAGGPPTPQEMQAIQQGRMAPVGSPAWNFGLKTAQDLWQRQNARAKLPDGWGYDTSGRPQFGLPGPQEMQPSAPGVHTWRDNQGVVHNDPISNAVIDKQGYDQQSNSYRPLGGLQGQITGGPLPKGQPYYQPPGGAPQPIPQVYDPEKMRQSFLGSQEYQDYSKTLAAANGLYGAIGTARSNNGIVGFTSLASLLQSYGVNPRGATIDDIEKNTGWGEQAAKLILKGLAQGGLPVSEMQDIVGVVQAQVQSRHDVLAQRAASDTAAFGQHVPGENVQGLPQLPSFQNISPKVRNPQEAQQALAAARTAIMRGAPRAAVIQRLQQAGVAIPPGF